MQSSAYVPPDADLPVALADAMDGPMLEPVPQRPYLQAQVCILFCRVLWSRCCFKFIRRSVPLQGGCIERLFGCHEMRMQGEAPSVKQTKQGKSGTH